MLELARGGARLGEDGAAVAVLGLVGEGDRLLQRVHAQTHQHGTKDLLGIGAVLAVHTGQNGGADEVALFKAGHLDAAAVQQQLGAVLHARSDELLHARLAVLADQRADLGEIVVVVMEMVVDVSEKVINGKEVSELWRVVELSDNKNTSISIESIELLHTISQIDKFKTIHTPPLTTLNTHSLLTSVVGSMPEPHLSLRAFSTISGSQFLLSPTKMTVDSAMHLCVDERRGEVKWEDDVKCVS